MSDENPVEADDATERILSAAREVFATDGLDASLGDVARHAGVGVGSIYRRFGNKDDLIQELAARRFEVIIDRVSSELDADDAWEAFATEFRQSVAEYATDRGFRELVIGSVSGTLGWARGSEPDRLRAAMGRWGAQMEAAINSLIERAQEEGTLRPDVSGSVILELSIALQSIAGLGNDHNHEKAIQIILDGLRVT
ncbi:TetR/AcrR family transcriptional regulator [Promicromonospora sp. Populi]|uniref:TetR/AcrR family transcriptional regulator n=1 Tax=Promicromonospora sp. Populi TaxID=3239420 RepID=UPI0034E24AC0